MSNALVEIIHCSQSTAVAIPQTFVTYGGVCACHPCNVKSHGTIWNQKKTLPSGLPKWMEVKHAAVLYTCKKWWNVARWSLSCSSLRSYNHMKIMKRLLISQAALSHFESEKSLITSHSTNERSVLQLILWTSFKNCVFFPTLCCSWASVVVIMSDVPRMPRIGRSHRWLTCSHTTQLRGFVQQGTPHQLFLLIWNLWLYVEVCA